MVVVEFLLVGRSPIGSAIRAVLLTALVTLFWTLFFLNERWTLFVVSLITALVIVLAAHLLSRRDNPLRPPQV